MVMTQGTEPSQSSAGDSVRITAAVRRQVLKEHYEKRLAHQRVVAQLERVDRKTQGFPGEQLYTTADLRVSNAVAVLQDIAASLSALGDNREFPAVQS